METVQEKSELKQQVEQLEVQVEEKMDKKKDRGELTPIPAHYNGILEDMQKNCGMSSRLAHALVRWTLDTQGKHMDSLLKLTDKLDEEKQYFKVKSACERRAGAWGAYLKANGFFSTDNIVYTKQLSDKTECNVHISIPDIKMVVKDGIVTLGFLIESTKDGVLKELAVIEGQFSQWMTSLLLNSDS
jgi:hypothetical protein